MTAWGCSGSSGGKETKKPRPADGEGGYKEGHLGAGAGVGSRTPGEQDTGGGQEENKDDVQIEGLLGTIDEQVVANAFAKKRYQIEQCILGHVRAMTYVTGKMNLHFDVAADGTVTVKVLDNTVGNYKVEECLLKLAKTLHFGKPKGGKAKVDYPPLDPQPGHPACDMGQREGEKRGPLKASGHQKVSKGREPQKVHPPLLRATWRPHDLSRGARQEGGAFGVCRLCVQRAQGGHLSRHLWEGG